jgi:hypothetical protein
VIGILSCVTTIGLFISIPFIYRLILQRSPARSWFASLSSLTVGGVFFLLTVMFVEEGLISIGLMMFLIVFVVGYILNYLLYPQILKFSKQNARPDK